MSNELSYYNNDELWTSDATEGQTEMVKLLLGMIPEDVESILDVGCGNGVITNELPGENVYGLDISEAALAHVGKNKVLGSIEDIPFPDRAFDLVLSTDVLEHLNNQVFRDSVVELKRVSNKYMIIATPYRENLDIAQTKCSHCGCQFHINRHTRSIDIEDIVELVGESEFKLSKIAFCGDEWATHYEQIAQLERVESNVYPQWEHAVCPNCDSPQEQISGNDVEDSVRLLFNRVKQRLHSDNISHIRRNKPTQCEMILFFERNTRISPVERTSSKTSLFCKGTKASVNLVVNDYGLIDMGNEVYTKKNTIRYGVYPYIVCHEESNWGAIEAVDGRRARPYVSGRDPFNHAVAIFPSDQMKHGEISISYKDSSNTPLDVQVYHPTKSYIPIGRLEALNDGLWKTTVFKLPPDIEISEEGIIFDLCNTTAGLPNYFIDRIWMGNSGSTIIPLETNEREPWMYAFAAPDAKLYDGLMTVDFGSSESPISLINGTTELQIWSPATGGAASVCSWLIGDRYLRRTFFSGLENEDLKIDYNLSSMKSLWNIPSNMGGYIYVHQLDGVVKKLGSIDDAVHSFEQRVEEIGEKVGRLESAPLMKLFAGKRREVE